jgi:hypothetical protein
MAQQGTRKRFFGSPFNDEVFDGRIERITEVPQPRGGMEIHVDFWGLLPTQTQLLVDRGQPWEIVRGERVPLRLRFTRASWIQRTGAFAALDAVHEDHPARHLFAVTHMRLPAHPPFYHLFTDGLFADDVLALRAQECLLEPLPGAHRSIEELRRWARRPPLANRLVPMPRALHRRYGGDPIAIHLGGRVHRQRLFIGGLHHQRAERPQLDHVVNLCGELNPWVLVSGAHRQDRHCYKGEMSDGMTPAELLAEAHWVTGQLRAGRRVLVHCYAGINRSSTLCCAALMALEGLTPEAALARVRERHPEASPDPYHWFVLRWLAASGARERTATAPGATATTPPAANAPLSATLRDVAVIR